MEEWQGKTSAIPVEHLNFVENFPQDEHYKYSQAWWWQRAGVGRLQGLGHLQ